MSNDLIIDEGFPVLNNFTPNKDDEKKKDPIPRCQFASYTNALSMPSVEHRTSFLNDCSMVFTARTKEDSEGYSTGSTYFLPCRMPPRCALEELAQAIFKAHVDTLEGCEDTDDNNDSKLANGNKKKLLYDPERSGAEWWTLVLDTPSSSNEESTGAIKKKDDDEDSEEEDVVAKWAKGKNEQKVQSSLKMAALLKRSKKDYEDLPAGFNLYNDTSDDRLNAESDSDDDDEVGMHFDADYGLEEQLPTHTLHPRVATITYLSDLGVPTIILDKRPPPPSDPEKQSLNGSINKAWLSHPHFGKHVSFDGRLLHGAPGSYFPSVAKNSNDCTSEPQAKRLKTDGNVDIFSGGGKRITFLVNIWLNHCPIDSEPLEDNIVKKLTTPWEAPIPEDTKCNLKVGDPIIPAFKWNVKDIETPDKLSNSISLSKASDSEGSAGEEGVVICNREVDILFGASMKDYHDASKQAASAEGGSLPIDMEEGVFTLKVGKEASDSDDDEEGE